MFLKIFYRNSLLVWRLINITPAFENHFFNQIFVSTKSTYISIDQKGKLSRSNLDPTYLPLNLNGNQFLVSKMSESNSLKIFVLNL